MHPGKVHSREINEGIVAGKYNVFRLHPALGTGESVSVYLLYRAVLVYLQTFCHGPDEFQGVELSLAAEGHRPGSGDRQLRRLHKGGRQPQGSGRSGLSLQLFPGIAVQISPLLLEIAVYAPLMYKSAVCLHRPQVCPGILSGFLRAKIVHEPPVYKTVLSRYFGRGVPALAPGNSVCLQNRRLYTRLL